MSAKLFTTPFAISGDRTPPVPDASQIDGSVSYTAGYGPDYELQLGVDPNAKNISREGFNSLLNDITTALREMQTGIGTPTFSATLATAIGGYPVGAIVPQASGSGVWICTTAGNSNNPDTGGAGWLPISVQVNYAVGAGTANAQTATYFPALPSTDGTIAKFSPIATNTGPMTFNSLPVVGGAGIALQGGEVAAGGITMLMRFGASWALVSSSGGAIQGATATKSQHLMTLGQATSAFAAQPGKIEWFASMSPPATHLAANGTAVSRTTYAALFATIAASVAGTVTSGSNSITGVASPSSMWVGMPISGPGIPAATTVTAVGGSTITLSANATATSTTTVTICPFGVGDGSTTFNLPDCRGVDFRGWDSTRGLDPSRVFGSYQADQMPAHGHPYGALAAVVAGSGSNVIQPGTTSGASTGVAGTGTEVRVKNIALLPCIRF
jgi:microcystin-dependent protein